MTEPSWTWTIEREIPSCSLHGHRLILEIVEQLQQACWKQKDIFGVHLALEEAVVNAIKHGNCEDPDKTVQVSCKISEERCWILVQDEGPGFCPDDVPDCTLDENLDKPSGRGLKLMRNFMTMVEYNEHGNRVVMEKVVERSSAES
jgi:serine/threonine-protein kinase RsbW